MSSPANASAYAAPLPASSPSEQRTAFKIIGGLGFAHFLNDMMQSLILALYPMFKESFHLSFVQIGYITLVYQLAASLFQPLIGTYTDKKPQPYSLAMAMGFTFCGLLLLAFATSYYGVLGAAVVVGIGSSIFHPEASRVARLASGGRHGLSQSLFQVGGNTGSAVGPLLAAIIILPYGRPNAAWFCIAALAAMVVLVYVGNWYRRAQAHATARRKARAATEVRLPRGKVIMALSVLLLLIFSKYFYLAGFQSYFTFYLIERFGISVQAAQVHLFVFLFASAAGTLLGGPIGDRIGRRRVIWGSIVGVAPFALILPYVGLAATTVLSFIIAFVLSSAFSAILVYAQELVPGRVGMISGLFFGFAFGMGGLGAATLGSVADAYGIQTVYHFCAYLPLLGFFAWFLPEMHIDKRKVIAQGEAAKGA